VRVSLLASSLLLSFSIASPAVSQAGPPVEAGPFRATDLVELASLDATIRLDVRYATPNNFVKRAVYAEARAFLQRPAAEALVRAHRALAKKGYGIVVFDGYRPWSVTRIFWDLTPESEKDFVADPKTGSRHNRGCAVDVSLYELATGKIVEMPSAYDEPTARSYPTFDGGDKAARERRDVLRRALEKESFFVLPWEWWHFDYKDWASYPVQNVAFSEIPKSDAARAAYLPQTIDLAAARFVDLTYAFDEKTIYWPNAKTAFVKRIDFFGKTDGGWFYSSNTICTPEHGGTHFDAPIHFSEGKESTADVPVSQLVGAAVVIDVTAQAAKDRDYRLTAEDVKAWEARNGRIPKGAIVLLRTGWGSRYPDRKSYLGDDTPGKTTDLHFPSFGKESALLLIRERGAGVIGVDTASIDHGPSADFIVHQIAGAASVAGLENVARLEELPETGAFVAALPMKIAGGSGGPLRIVALIPR
jgi:kynurenine formamidase/D-alanyl-D-alanine dipeptidase